MHEFQAYENKLLRPRPSYAYLFRKVTSQLGVKKRLKTEKIHQSAQ